MTFKIPSSCICTCRSLVFFFPFLYTSKDIFLKGFAKNSLGLFVFLSFYVFIVSNYSTPTCLSKKLSFAQFPYFAEYV